jgi:hypothetical protein
MRPSVIVLLVAATAGAAPPMPKDEKSDALYFPVQVGAKRVTAMTIKADPSRSIGYSEVVTKVEEKNGQYSVTVERDTATSGRKVVQVYLVSKDGLFLKSQAGKENPEPEPVLKLPYKQGTEWTTEIATPPGGPRPKSVKLKHTMSKVEEVEVPAGKYKAIRVEQVAEAGQSTRKTTYWYAAGIGMVKAETEGSTTELTEFTPGKDSSK